MASLDPVAAERAARVARVPGMLIRRLRAEAHGITGLTLSQESTISRLMDVPTGMSSAELARAEGVRPQTMSTAVAGLQKAGLVRGEPDPADGRRTILHVSEKGMRAVTEARDVKLRWLQELLSEFGAEELRALDEGRALLERVAES